MDRNIRTVDDVLKLQDGLFAPEADRWTADAGSSGGTVAWAQDRARDAGAEVRFLCGDAFALTATGTAARTT
jgi:hypothetical protein